MVAMDLRVLAFALALKLSFFFLFGKQLYWRGLDLGVGRIFSLLVEVDDNFFIINFIIKRLIIGDGSNKHYINFNYLILEHKYPVRLINKLLRLAQQNYICTYLVHMKNNFKRQRYFLNQQQQLDYYPPENVLHQYSENVSYQTVPKSLQYALLLSSKEDQNAITTWNQNLLHFNSINSPIKISLPNKSNTGPTLNSKKSVTEYSTSRYFYLRHKQARQKLKTYRAKCALSLVSPSLDGQKQQPKGINLNKTSFSFGTNHTRESIRERKKMVIKKIKKEQPYGIQSINLQQCALTQNSNTFRERKRLSLKPSAQAQRKLIQTYSEMRQANSKNPKYQISLKITKITPDQQTSFHSKNIRKHPRTLSQQNSSEPQNQMKVLNEFKRLSFLISQQKIQKPM